MQYVAGTLVWVHCEDDVWWPAKVAEVNAATVREIDPSKDSCVEFYHHPGEYYMVQSTDQSTVHPLHSRLVERDATEHLHFAHPSVQVAVAKALADPNVTSLPAPVTSSLGQISFSSTQQKQIQQLLEAMRAEQRLPASTTKRGPTPFAAVAAPAWKKPRVSMSDESVRSSTVVELPTTSTASTSALASPPSIPYTAPVSNSVLRVLKSTAFLEENFVLSPVYEFVDILGAVEVSSTSLWTNFPTPGATRYPPEGGFSATRRVLLLPLDSSEDHSHKVGWLLPLRIDDKEYDMKLKVNGRLVPVPGNWVISASKEGVAVKTAPVLDITSLVLTSHDQKESDDVFTLEVAFPTLECEMILWDGLIVCIFVDEVPLSIIEKRVQSYFHPVTLPPPSPTKTARRGRRTHTQVAEEGLDIVEGSLTIRCPLTTAVLSVPVRGVHCEHLQCMELSAVLSQCHRSNIWNCPLCWKSMRPTEMRIHYKLQQWIRDHPRELSRVDYVTENGSQPLTPHYTTSHSIKTAETVILD